MKVFIVGATGVLGRRLVSQLSVRNHTVVGLARRPKNQAVIRSLGADIERAVSRRLGWTPRFPSYREGLDEIAARWTSEGFPPAAKRT